MKPLLFALIAITALSGCASRIKTLDTVNFTDYPDLTALYDDLRVPLRWKVTFTHRTVDRTVREPRIIAERYCESQYGQLIRVAKQKEILNLPYLGNDEDYYRAVNERVQTSFGHFDCMSLIGTPFWRVSITHGGQTQTIGEFKETVLHIDVYDSEQTRAMREEELALYDQPD